MMVSGGRAQLSMSPPVKGAFGLFVCRWSDLSAAHGVPGPNCPALGVELGEEQGEGQALLSRAHWKR